jgi:SNF2 family DNA or RNA helicase
VWVDNKDYQRADYIGACKYLGIENPNLPHIEGLYLSCKFDFYQPTAIEAMVDFENSPIHGGVLAEDVGLGKTVEAIGLLLFRPNERNRLINNDQEVPPALPTFIIPPPLLIMQWRSEIKRFTNSFDIVVYWGTSKRTLADCVVYFKGKLNRPSEFFNGDGKISRCIILSTYNTWVFVTDQTL